MSQTEWNSVPDEIIKRARRNWYAMCFHRAETAKTLNDPLAHLGQFEAVMSGDEVRGVRCKNESTHRVFLSPENSAAMLEQQANALRQHFQSGKRILIIAGLCSGRLLDTLK
ncbi:hypothetical protein K8I31_16970, partial [bacterium]|nr:hypothetical protein [bacterium]